MNRDTFQAAADKAQGRTNASADPLEGRDFASIQVIADHLMHRDDGHYVTKFVLSTQSPVEVLGAVAAYYGETELLAAPRSLAIIQASGGEDDPVLVYLTKENTQIIMSTETWAAFVDRVTGGNQLAASDYLCKMVANLQADSIRAHGSPTLLSMLSFAGAIDLGEAEQEAKSAE